MDNNDQWVCDSCDTVQTLGWDESLGDTGLPTTHHISDDGEEVLLCEDCSTSFDPCDPALLGALMQRE